MPKNENSISCHSKIFFLYQNIPEFEDLDNGRLVIWTTFVMLLWYFCDLFTPVLHGIKKTSTFFKITVIFFCSTDVIKSCRSNMSVRKWYHLVHYEWTILLSCHLNGQQLKRGKKHSYVYVVHTIQPIKRAIIFSFVCQTVDSIHQVKSGFSVWAAVVLMLKSHVDPRSSIQPTWDSDNRFSGCQSKLGQSLITEAEAVISSRKPNSSVTSEEDGSALNVRRWLFIVQWW